MNNNWKKRMLSVEELKKTIGWRRPAHPINQVTEDIDYIDVTNASKEDQQLIEGQSLPHHWNEHAITAEEIEEKLNFHTWLINKTALYEYKLTQVPENIEVHGKNYSLAGMKPVNGQPGAVSVCYKPDLTIE